MRRILVTICLVGSFGTSLFCTGSLSAIELAIDDIMWKDPPFTPATLKHTFPTGFTSLWGQALQRPESELRRSAADTIAIAHKRGMTGLKDLTGQLVEVLKSTGQDTTARRAAAHALVTIDAREQASLLAQVAEQDGLEVAQFVEPALAKWSYSPIQKIWLERVDNPATRQLWLLLAMQCLAETKDTAARGPLLKLVHDRKSPPNVRTAAAQALARIFSDGLVGEAKQHVDAPNKTAMVERLLSVTLVSRHSDAEAIVLLKQLANDEEPAVASAALGRLFAIDPALVVDLATTAIKNRDVNVRRVGVDALIVKADEASLRQLTPLLNDPNPTLRTRVANAFADLAARTELRNTVIEEAERSLTQDQWRGLEKAILLAVHLERKNTANRMLELLKHRRSEVNITAAWALRRFQLPETLPQMLEHAQLQYDRTVARQFEGFEAPSIGGQQSQLFQAFGQLRYKEAESLMRKFVPKNFSLATDARAAACWSLGYLFEDQDEKGLAKQFIERLADVSSMTPELTEVRITCAVSLGRMNSKSGLPDLRDYAKNDGITSAVGQSCWWSIEKMTEDKRPPLPELTQRIIDWFLRPVD